MADGLVVVSKIKKMVKEAGFRTGLDYINSLSTKVDAIVKESIEKVKTDRDRLSGIEGEFLQLVAENPLKDILQSNYLGQGYMAPRLDGIWARFPYLHNGSVPNMKALLTPPDERPKVFSVKNAGSRERFDQRFLGLTLETPKVRRRLLRRRSIYDVSRPGQSNRGHSFYTDLTDDEKFELIEYLKTL